MYIQEVSYADNLPYIIDYVICGPSRPIKKASASQWLVLTAREGTCTFKPVLVSPVIFGVTRITAKHGSCYDCRPKTKTIVCLAILLPPSTIPDTSDCVVSGWHK